MGLDTGVQIPGRVIPKTLKMVLDAALVNTLYHKVRSKAKWSKFSEISSAFPPNLSVVATEKGAFWLPLTKLANFT